MFDCLRALWPKEPTARNPREEPPERRLFKISNAQRCLSKGLEPAAFRLPFDSNLTPRFRTGSLY